MPVTPAEVDATCDDSGYAGKAPGESSWEAQGESTREGTPEEAPGGGTPGERTRTCQCCLARNRTVTKAAPPGSCCVTGSRARRSRCGRGRNTWPRPA